LNLANLGGGVSPPVVTSVRRRALLSEAWDAANAGEVGHAARTLLAAGRQLLQQGSVNAQYNVLYPSGGTTSTNVLTQLQNAIANGAVTQSLNRNGFVNARANSATVFLSTASPTPAPSILSTNNIIIITVLGFAGVCGLCGLAYFCLCRVCAGPAYAYDEGEGEVSYVSAQVRPIYTLTRPLSSPYLAPI